MKILLIEDDPMWQKIFRLFLEKLGDVRLAKNIREVEYHLQLSTPDFILADIQLAGVSTIDYFQLKTDMSYPILFTTAFLSDEIMLRTGEIPFSLFLAKPVEPLTLEASIIHLRKYFTSSLSLPLEITEGVWTKNKFNQSVLVPFQEILFIKGEGNYTFVQTAKKIFPFKKSLSQMIQLLTPSFTRISKSIVINTDLSTNYQLIFNDLKIGTYTFKVGRTYRKALLEKISDKLDS